MSGDDIIRMAREAGFADDKGTVHPAYQLEAFANLVAAHKAEVALAEAYRCGYKDGMEAGAVICDNVASKYQHGHYPGAETIADECAAAIRARGTP